MRRGADHEYFSPPVIIHLVSKWQWRYYMHVSFCGQFPRHIYLGSGRRRNRQLLQALTIINPRSVRLQRLRQCSKKVKQKSFPFSLAKTGYGSRNFSRLGKAFFQTFVEREACGADDFLKNWLMPSRLITRACSLGADLRLRVC